MSKSALIDSVLAAEQGGNPRQTFASYKDGYKVGGGLTLVDPITQIARRIEAFFKDDKDVVTAFKINNSADLADGQDHLAELCIYVQCGYDVTDTEKADCISNFIRHRHVYPEYGFDGSLLRNHILNVRVFAVGAIDPNDPSQTERISECAFITDEHSQCAVTREQWVRKFDQLQTAFKGNPNVAKMFTYTSEITGTVFGFIECAAKPVAFREDNITNFYGFNSELSVDILPLAFVFNGEFQLCTYVNPVLN